MSATSSFSLVRRHGWIHATASMRRCCGACASGSMPRHRALSTSALLRFKDKEPDIPKTQATGLGVKQMGRWKDTLQLPSTPFEQPMLPELREKLWRKRTTTDLYRWQAAQTERPLFVLHDGPPYANGSIHMGHAINKICKDIINRQQILLGKRVHYHPGWDCHGLPIENKVVEKPDGGLISLKRISPIEVRTAARKVADEAIRDQMETFKSFALMADWSEETTYRTFDKDYVQRQLRLLREMVRRGLVYRANRPVFWSPTSKTAIAEAEVEYMDTFMSRSVYVRFPLRPGAALLKLAEECKDHDAQRMLKMASRTGSGINLIIWTTTAWTLPSNMAVNVNPDISYSLVRAQNRHGEGELMIMASERLARLERLKIGLNTVAASERPRLGPLEVLMTFEGSALLDATYRHPYLPHEEDSRPIIAASYVSAESGTGIVHSAPGHGKDDYLTWQEFCKRPGNERYAAEPILSPVNDSSRYTDDVRELANKVEFVIRSKSSYTPDKIEDSSLAGQIVFTAGSSSVIRTLHYTGDLLTEIHVHHRYPHDWRSKEPIIVRSTPQWFANLEPIKDKALEALKNVRFTPPTGRARLESLVKSRGEWCISRQRAWGVPIPVLYDVLTDEPLMTQANMQHIESVLADKGLDYWWTADADEFVAPSERDPNRRWRKGTDIVDVWFDSGSSWTQLPGAKELFEGADAATTAVQAPNHAVADMYFEGPDQHRGWFQSSLLTYVALGGSGEATADDASTAVSAPYKNIFTHGFLTNRRHEKLSKSNEGISLRAPSFYINGGHKRNDPPFGADSVRAWAARGDPQTDVILSELAVKHSFQVLYKIRITLRYLLSVLPPRDEAPRLEDRQVLTLHDRYVLDELFRFDQHCLQAYADFDFAQVMRRLSEFSASVLSNYYFDVSKDSLYSDRVDSAQRQTTLAIFDQVLRTMLSVVAPVAPHLAEEVWHYYLGGGNAPLKEQGETSSTSSYEDPKSFFQMGWQRVSERWRDEEAEQDIKDLFVFRTSLLATLEQGRLAKVLTTSGGVDVDVMLGPLPTSDGQDVSSETDRIRAALRKHAAALPQLFLLGEVKLLERWLTPEEDTRPSPDFLIDGEHDGIIFHIRPAIKAKCPRCRLHQSEEQGCLCKRCRDAVPSDMLTSEHM